MKRLILASAICFLLIVPVCQPVSAKDSWTSVHSKNFFLVGNASEKEIRQVATRLEQFRDVFARLFPGTKFTSPIPTTVFVFKSDSSYKPFKPVVDGKISEVAGYFQSGREVNYITLTTEKRSDNPYSTIFHEYVHLLVNNTMGKTNVPPWFNEGLAEYYSTFDVENDQKVYLGNLIPYHLELLRTTQLFPLEKLFAVDYYSLERNKHDARGLFYAESWVLIHYLIQGNEGRRVHQLTTFLGLLLKSTPVETAFRQAFQTDYAGMQKELKDYIQHHTHRLQVATFERRLEFDSEMQASPITDAEAQAYLGDLLFHIQRPDDAITRLQQALALDPNLGMAHASLGMVLMERKKFDEAKQHLQQAVAGNSPNYLAHYYYAYALSREGMNESQMVYSYAPDTAQKMRAELRKAIELKPDFPESYHLLAFVNLVTNEQLDESITIIKRAVALSPGSEEFLFILAQIYMRKQDFDGARKIIEPLAANGADPQIRANARSLLASITSLQEELARFRTARAERPAGEPDDRPALRNRNNAPDHVETVEKIDPSPYLQQALRKPADGEAQVQGTLVRIDCDAKGITFIIKTDDRLLKLKTDSFQHIDITTFTVDVAGEITCGPRKLENPVVVCYLPLNDGRAKVDGRAKSIEFVPKEFKLKSKQ